MIYRLLLQSSQNYTQTNSVSNLLILYNILSVKEYKFIIELIYIYIYIYIYILH